MKQVMLYFGDLKSFLDSNEDIGPATHPKLLAVLNNSQQLALLRIELAATIDCGEPFVKACYHFWVFWLVFMLTTCLMWCPLPSLFLANLPQIQHANSGLTICKQLYPSWRLFFETAAWVQVLRTALKSKEHAYFPHIR